MIVLAAAAGKENKDIAADVHISRGAVDSPNRVSLASRRTRREAADRQKPVTISSGGSSR
jgi:hypothetical protein